MNDTCVQPLPIADLIDYSLGELEPPQESAVEEHLFSCETCTRALEAVVRLGTDIARAVSTGQTIAPVSEALVRRAAARGAQIRQYNLAPGDAVACTAAPGDTFVTLRLSVPLDGVSGVAVETAFEDLASGQRSSHRLDDVPVDAIARQVVLLFPGRTIRAYPRSRWTMHLDAVKDGTDVRLGPYMLDHTPWEQLRQTE
jgi:hypothetical protein